VTQRNWRHTKPRRRHTEVNARFAVCATEYCVAGRPNSGIRYGAIWLIYWQRLKMHELCDIKLCKVDSDLCGVDMYYFSCKAYHY
jgi:hypothetical protein